MSPKALSSTHAFDRQYNLGRLHNEVFDVLVVGGGVTGAGVALEAASRGLRAALVERHDFASGTSSRSSKLVHGGLRYLQHREIALVYQALRERQRLLHNAPHLVRVLPFLIPLFGREGVVSRSMARTMSTILWLYDLTGGARIGKLHERISVDEARRHLPTLRADEVTAAWLYYDAQADDARLTLTILRTAVIDHAAVAVNHLGVVGLLKDIRGRVAGARLSDGSEVRAKSVVNATGVWADSVRALEATSSSGGSGPCLASKSIRPAKGVHITLPWSKIRCDVAAVLPVPADRRSIFVVPCGDRVYAGTTDTDYDGSLDDPQCTPAEVDYILSALNAALEEPVGPQDVLGSWAGLRPLLAHPGASARTADLSRRHTVRRSSSGVVTITGGKLTTYRPMAVDAVDATLEVLERRAGPSRSQNLRLRGADGWEEVDNEHLRRRYGSEARVLLAMVDADPSLGRPLVASLPYLAAEAVYGVRYEMAVTLDDVLSRRTRARVLARDASSAAADEVARLIAPDLGWTESQAAAEAAAYRASIAAERHSVRPPEPGSHVPVGP